MSTKVIIMNPFFCIFLITFVCLQKPFMVTAWKPSFIHTKAYSMQKFHKAVLTGIVSAVLLIPNDGAHALEQQYKLPPIDFADKNRCTLVSSSMGQANAARDKLYDLRQCDLTKQSAANKDLSGMIASEADFSGVNFKETQMSKAFAKNSKFVNADFSNAIVDRAIFDESDLTNAVFTNAVLSGTTFTNANLKNTDFSDAYLGPFDLKNLCLNPTLEGKNPKTGIDTKESAGCF